MRLDGAYKYKYKYRRGEKMVHTNIIQIQEMGVDGAYINKYKYKYRRGE